MHTPTQLLEPGPERQRLAALRALGVLDRPPDPASDDLARLAAHSCDAPYAFIALVDADRVWIRASHGLSLCQVARETSFCTHTIRQRDVFVVPDALADARFTKSPLVMQAPQIRFYAGAPLVTAEGFGLGTVCVLDTVPRVLTQRQLDALSALGRYAVEQLKRRVESERRRLLLEVTNALAVTRDLDGLLRVTFESLRGVLASDRSALMIYKPETDSLRIFAFESRSPSAAFGVGVDLPRTASPVGWVYEHRQPLIRRDLLLEQESAFEKGLAKEGVRSFCFVPLLVAGRCLGTLNLGSYSPDFFAASHVEFLQEVANQVALAVANTQAYEQIAALKTRLQSENAYLREEISAEHNFEEIVGRSPSLLEALRKVESVAPTDSTVLLTGETGTGKELFARAIHRRSGRKDRPLVKVNCGAIPPGLVESELFGHVKGAFTGAVQNRVGRFELADRGTLFLDEVSELPPEIQVKLLRVLQEQEFEPVGASRTVRVDVRVIAATNRPLEAAVAAGRFRADLMYRLNVFPLSVPPLRERRADIPLLTSFLLGRLAHKLGKPLERVSARAMAHLSSYDWPGNVRELQNVVERAAILSRGPVVDFEPELLGGQALPAAGAAPITLEAVERAHILLTLDAARWVVEGPRGAADVLGLHPNTLRSMIKRLGLVRPPISSHEQS